MNVLRICALVSIAAFGLSACKMTDPPSRGQSGSQALLAQDAGQGGYAVQKVNIAVPQSLAVSEENSYVPVADIVWHGDAAGDRRAQVSKIMQTAMAQGTASADQQGPPRAVGCGCHALSCADGQDPRAHRG
jgi:hypothetical protein